MPFGLHLPSIILGLLLAHFALPFLMGLVYKFKSGGDAA